MTMLCNRCELLFGDCRPLAGVACPRRPPRPEVPIAQAKPEVPVSIVGPTRPGQALVLRSCRRYAAMVPILVADIE